MLNEQQAKVRMEEVIHSRLQDNARVLDDALRFVPEDRKAPAEAVRWEVTDGNIVQMVVDEPIPDTSSQPRLVTDEPRLVTRNLGLHEHALGHASGISGVNKTFINTLLGTGDKWARDLVAHNLNETWHNLREKDGRPPAHLVRVDHRNQREPIKAILSSSYKTIDVRPMLHEFLMQCDAFGVQPYRAGGGEITFAVKMILPRVFMIGSDPYAIGVELRNTDWGGVAAAINVFFERLVCLNGMTTEKVFRQVHSGAKLDRDIEWSDKTRQLARDTSISQMRDVVRGFFEPARLDSMVAQLQAAGKVEISRDKLEARLKGKLPQDTAKRVVELFESADDIRVPAGPSWMRAAQAVSAISQDIGKKMTEEGRDGGETLLDMERLAGSLMVEGAEAAKAA